jgi:hypothetical protein
MTKQEMIDILEALIRDPDTNATAKCTAIRTLREMQPDKSGELVDLDDWRRLDAVRKDRKGA